MVIYSHSRLSTFEQCPFKFKLRYIDEIKPDIDTSIEAHLGSAVHSTLEWFYRQIKINKQPELDELMLYYLKIWNKTYTDNMLIVRKNLTKKDYLNKGVKFLIDYYQKHKPFRDNTIDVEKRIIVSVKNYKIQGFIDRLVHNVEKDEYEIHDYKTGNYFPSRESFEKDRQLALYSIGIKELFGENKKVRLVWHYLAHNTKISSKRTNQQLQILKQEIFELIKKIESTKEFPTKKSNLCSWCEYKSMCHEFGGKINEHQKKLCN
jgi:putative RecB family exonuclease